MGQPMDKLVLMFRVIRNQTDRWTMNIVWCLSQAAGTNPYNQIRHSKRKNAYKIANGFQQASPLKTWANPSRDQVVNTNYIITAGKQRNMFWISYRIQTRRIWIRVLTMSRRTWAYGADYWCKMWFQIIKGTKLRLQKRRKPGLTDVMLAIYSSFSALRWSSVCGGLACRTNLT